MEWALAELFEETPFDKFKSVLDESTTYREYLQSGINQLLNPIPYADPFFLLNSERSFNAIKVYPQSRPRIRIIKRNNWIHFDPVPFHEEIQQSRFVFCIPREIKFIIQFQSCREKFLYQYYEYETVLQDRLILFFYWLIFFF